MMCMGPGHVLIELREEIVAVVFVPRVVEPEADHVGPEHVVGLSIIRFIDIDEIHRIRPIIMAATDARCGAALPATMQRGHVVEDHPAQDHGRTVVKELTAGHGQIHPVG